VCDTTDRVSDTSHEYGAGERYYYLRLGDRRVLAGARNCKESVERHESV